RVVDFKRVMVEPTAVAVGLVNQLVVLPAAGFLLAWAFALPPPMAVGFVLITACPGGPSSNLYSNLARGDTALSVTLTALSGVATMVTIPFVVGLALDTFMGTATDITIDVGSTVVQLLFIVGVPLALGMFVRAHRPTKAEVAEKHLKRVAVGLLLVLIIGAIAKERTRVAEQFTTLGIPVLVLSLGTIMLGLLSALAFRLPLRQAVTIGIEVGMQNAALGIGLAINVLGSEEIAMPAVVYGILAYFTCAVALAIGRRFIPHHDAPAAPAPARRRAS
ncbi:MAG: bile acid:sodium symporter family protein, partial [Myxococcales bacterium]|nr:bile acid:sodium symporter family protein [Myxococcales bacterium]